MSLWAWVWFWDAFLLRRLCSEWNRIEAKRSEALPKKVIQLGEARDVTRDGNLYIQNCTCFQISDEVSTVCRSSCFVLYLSYFHCLKGDLNSIYFQNKCHLVLVERLIDRLVHLVYYVGILKRILSNFSNDLKWSLPFLGIRDT